MVYIYICANIGGILMVDVTIYIAYMDPMGYRFWMFFGNKTGILQIEGLEGTSFCPGGWMLHNKRSPMYANIAFFPVN